jgi:periplasmic protein TonB
MKLTTIALFLSAAVLLIATNCGVSKNAQSTTAYWAAYYKNQLHPEMKLIEAGPTHSVEQGNGFYLRQEYYYDTKVVLSSTRFTDAAQNNRSGLSTRYNMSGKKMADSNYKNDKLNGAFINYYVPSGLVSAETQYVDNKRDGLSTHYDENGKKKLTEHFKKDSLDGERILFQPDGSVKIRQKWANGKLIEGPEEEKQNSGPGDLYQLFELTGEGGASKAPAFPCHPQYASLKERCGEMSMQRYISQNLNYPKQVRELGITGRVVVLFAIDKSGKVSEVEVIRANCDALRDEAARCIKSMPRWEPGMLDGQPVKVQFTLPLTFKLE